MPPPGMYQAQPGMQQQAMPSQADIAAALMRRQQMQAGGMPPMSAQIGQPQLSQQMGMPQGAPQQLGQPTLNGQMGLPPGGMPGQGMPQGIPQNPQDLQDLLNRLQQQR